MKFCLLTLTGTQRTAEQAGFSFFNLDASDLERKPSDNSH